MGPPLRTVTVSELTMLASEYAEAMARELAVLNTEYTNPASAGMNRREKENLKKYGTQAPHPTPEQLIPEFERLFWHTMAEHFHVIPDEDSV